MRELLDVIKMFGKFNHNMFIEYCTLLIRGAGGKKSDGRKDKCLRYISFTEQNWSVK